MLKDVRAALLSWMKKKEQFNSNEAAAMTYQLVHTQKTEDKKYHFFFKHIYTHIMGKHNTTIH